MDKTFLIHLLVLGNSTATLVQKSFMSLVVKKPMAVTTAMSARVACRSCTRRDFSDNACSSLGNASDAHPSYPPCKSIMDWAKSTQLSICAIDATELSSFVDVRIRYCATAKSPTITGISSVPFLSLLLWIRR